MQEISRFSQKNASKPALVTFIYPSATQYIDFFVQNINAQTTADFVLLVFNDGVEKAETFFETVNVPFLICEVEGANPMEIRFAGLEALKTSVFQRFIFQDSDDGLSANRLSTVHQLLNDYSIVVNDLDLMNEEGVIFKRSLWKSRFDDNNVFEAQNISNCNFAGLGNTGITAELLRFLPPMPSIEVIAVDWYLFYVALAKSGKSGCCTSECTSFYRQHVANTIGLRQPNQELMDKTRQLHYEALKQSAIEIERSKNETYNQKPDAFWWETEV